MIDLAGVSGYAVAMTNFLIHAYDRKAKVPDHFVLEAISAQAAEKLARDILFKRDGDWRITLVDDDPSS